MNSEGKKYITELLGFTEELVRDGKSVKITLQGTSMLPCFRPGDTALISPLPEKGFYLGDIVVFQYEGKYLAHRSVKKMNNINGNVILTKGDSCPVCDAPVLMHDVIGLMVQVERSGKVFYQRSSFRIFCNRFRAFYSFFQCKLYRITHK
jgi:signal peptidase I